MSTRHSMLRTCGDLRLVFRKHGDMPEKLDGVIKTLMRRPERPNKAEVRC